MIGPLDVHGARKLVRSTTPAGKPNQRTSEGPAVRLGRAGVRILDYANGAGGRIFDLPRSYQDAIAAVVRTMHPKTVTRQVQRVMASDGYLRSTHPLIRGHSGDAQP